jgi:hypothetical protein
MRIITRLTARRAKRREERRQAALHICRTWPA